jgi:hypothetical protein
MKPIGIGIGGAMLLVSFVCFSQQIDDPFADDFDALDAELEQQFLATDESLEKQFQRIKQAVDDAYTGLTEKISVNWKSDIKLPEQSSWVTYDDSFMSRAQFDFSKGYYQVETIVDDDLASSLLKLKAMAVVIASADQKTLQQKDVFNQEVNKQLNASFYLDSSFQAVSQSVSVQHINVTQVLPINTESIIAKMQLADVNPVATEPKAATPFTYKDKPAPAPIKTQGNEAKVAIKDTLVQTSLPEERDLLKRSLADPLPTQGAVKVVVKPDEIVTQSDVKSIIPSLVKERNTEVDAADSVQLEPIESRLPAASTDVVAAIISEGKTSQQLVMQQSKPTTASVSAIVRALESKELTDAPVETPIAQVVQQPLAIVAPVLKPELRLEQKGEVTKLVLTIPFINRYQQRLIETRIEKVKSLAQQYDIDASLILAVIETESSFNPMATSAIPAFGLMQLVPQTAGLDAYKFVYGQQRLVTPEYLYNQDNNMLLGTAYLHLLSNRYLRGINDQQSKLYCMLASYNTGVGNLAKSFVNRKNLGLAIKHANTMNAEQVYRHLMQNLPADETKQYLKKVLSRQVNYIHFDQI